MNFFQKSPRGSIHYPQSRQRAHVILKVTQKFCLMKMTSLVTRESRNVKGKLSRYYNIIRCSFILVILTGSLLIDQGIQAKVTNQHAKNVCIFSELSLRENSLSPSKTGSSPSKTGKRSTFSSPSKKGNRSTFSIPSRTGKRLTFTSPSKTGKRLTLISPSKTRNRSTFSQFSPKTHPCRQDTLTKHANNY